MPPILTLLTAPLIFLPLRGSALVPADPLVICSVLLPANVRLDLLNMSRVVDSELHVVGVRLDGSKVGGSTEGAVLLIPDPMGATGGTIVHVVASYQRIAGGNPRTIVALHLTVAPEVIARATHDSPEVKIHGGRLDRGLSTKEALRSIPETLPQQERGLNDVQYIVLGAGGMGELLTVSC